MSFFSTLDLDLQHKYANHHGYTDIKPFEITKRVSSFTLEIRKMDTEQDMSVKPSFDIGGFCAHSDNAQKWHITSNETNPTICIRLHSDKIWRDKYGNKYCLSDTPRKFHDYNF